MGKKSSKKAAKPRKIRTRSDQEIIDVMAAYNGLFKTDPFRANMMLMLSELSEYIPVPPLWDKEKIMAFVEENQEWLEKQYAQRFINVGVDGRAFPLPDTIPGRLGLINPDPKEN
jgi:hypothetical protein